MCTESITKIIYDRDMLKFVLALSAQEKRVREEVDSLFMVAISYGCLDMASMLLERGANPNAQVKILSYGNAPVLYAGHAENRNETLLYLLQNGLDVTLPYEEGNTSLHHMAMTIPSINLWSLALSNLQDVDLRNKREETPLHVATYMENWKVVDLLIKSGANVNAQDDIGDTLLHNYVKDYSSDIPLGGVKKLLKLGADVKIRNKSGMLASDIAAVKNADKILLELLT